MLAIMKREFKAYFTSPIGFVFVGLIILLTGLLSTAKNLLEANSDYSEVLSSMRFVFLIAVPILTMRLLAEEAKQKTEQLLYTSPIAVLDIVLGKYFASTSLFLLTLVVSLVYPIALSFYAAGGLAWLEIAGAYLGFFLLGASLIAVGLFFSSITENQIIAAVETFAALLLIWILDLIVQNLPSGAVAGIVASMLQWFSLLERYNDFRLGIIGPESFLYYFSFTGIFIYLTIRRMEAKRWR